MAAVTDSGVKLWFKYDSRTQLQDDVCREQAAGLMCVCVFNQSGAADVG